MLRSFGSNGRGQLSLAHTADVHTPSPCILPADARPLSIVAGGNHTLLLTASGDLFACGDNTHNQCVVPAVPAVHSFSCVPLPPGSTEWTLAAAGWDFSVLVSDTAVFVSGHGTKGELGLGAAVSAAACQRLVGFPPAATSVRRISSCVAHTVAVLSDGSVYGWGAGRKGQLGTPQDAVVAVPRRVPVDWDVEWAVCGREFTLVVERVRDPRARRRTCVLGGDRYGVREALGTWLDPGVEDVQAGWNAVYVLYSGGRLVGFGRNDRGQLPPPGLGPVERFAAGSEHVVAVVGGRLVAWGWGEHGNCGRGREEPGGGDVVGVAAEVEVPGAGAGAGQIGAVGAGCATSWVWAGAGGQIGGHRAPDITRTL